MKHSATIDKLRNSASSSIFTYCLLSRIRYTSSHLHYMMFQTIQTIYFLRGYDPGNISVSFIAELSPVYCFLVICFPTSSKSKELRPSTWGIYFNKLLLQLSSKIQSLKTLTGVKLAQINQSIINQSNIQSKFSAKSCTYRRAKAPRSIKASIPPPRPFLGSTCTCTRSPQR